MKKFIFLFALIYAMSYQYFSQKASDYYLPLCVGNNIVLTSPTTGLWEACTMVISIVKEDTLDGYPVYLEKKEQFLNSNPNNPILLHLRWFREDSLGNIILVAICATESEELDSATVLSPGFNFFPNEVLNLGYNRHYTFKGETTYDTVVSVSATAGSYINCIKIRETILEAGNLKQVDEKYCALNIGLVKKERFYPNAQIHTETIVSYVANSCNSGIDDVINNDKDVLNIYPNPAKDIINIDFENSNIDNNILNIYDVNGKKIKTMTLSNSQRQINLKGVNSGVYLFELKKGFITRSKKVIINKKF